GIDVRRRNVGFRAECADDARRVTACDALELVARQPRPSAQPPAFLSAEWNVDDCAFPRHPCSEGTDFVGSHAHVEAYPSLAGPSCSVVNHAIACENLYVTGIHLDGDGNLNLVLRLAEYAIQACVETE